ncbi:PP2C family protein-serine/threonine phosphatase [Streptomyces sp. NPDC058374]|uniref:PP2C family protein-serine/threonine phosphatase n=1 Tax=unclassified Streptomyces TaxID=2593676 RepID=UPI00364A4C10
MTAPHFPNVAGIDSTVPAPAQTVAPSASTPAAAAPSPATVIQDRLAGWVSDLTTLHELTERLIATSTVDAALQELLHAGASLVGARRGLAALEPGGPDSPRAAFSGLGLGRADLGHIETVPRAASSYGRLLDEPLGGRREICHPDLASDLTADPRHREVAARLGWAASYAAALETRGEGRFGAVVWLYDEPAEPDERRRHLAGLYLRQAGEHLARLLTLDAARATVATLREELLPSRLPRVAGVRLAARHRTGPRGGGDWYDALPLPEGALGLAIGSVTGAGPSAVAAMGRLRASLRAYAVMEGEDPVAVLSDLELLLRLTEPARSATALFGYCDLTAGPGPERGRRLVLAGAGHCPPVVVSERGAEFVETSLSAPLGMLACWEAPSVELRPRAGDTVLLYSDGLLRRTGDSMDRAFARLHSAAASVPKGRRDDPGAVADHVLDALLPEGTDDPDSAEDMVLLAAHFD